MHAADRDALATKKHEDWHMARLKASTAVDVEESSRAFEFTL